MPVTGREVFDSTGRWRGCKPRRSVAETQGQAGRTHPNSATIANFKNVALIPASITAILRHIPASTQKKDVHLHLASTAKLTCIAPQNWPSNKTQTSSKRQTTTTGPCHKATACNSSSLVIERNRIQGPNHSVRQPLQDHIAFSADATPQRTSQLTYRKVECHLLGRACPRPERFIFWWPYRQGFA